VSDQDPFVVGATTIQVSDGNLLTQPVAAIMISANNHLNGQSSWAKDIRLAAGPRYEAECRRLVAATGARGFHQGTAVVTGGYQMARGNDRRWVIQAITIAYQDGHRVRATPDIVYAATRAALEKAEVFQVPSVAAYLMAARYPDYATSPAIAMAEALCYALLDHAMIAVTVRQIILCEHNQRGDDFDRVKTARDALQTVRS